MLYPDYQWRDPFHGTVSWSFRWCSNTVSNRDSPFHNSLFRHSNSDSQPLAQLYIWKKEQLYSLFYIMALHLKVALYFPVALLGSGQSIWRRKKTNFHLHDGVTRITNSILMPPWEAWLMNFHASLLYKKFRPSLCVLFCIWTYHLCLFFIIWSYIYRQPESIFF